MNHLSKKNKLTKVAVLLTLTLQVFLGYGCSLEGFETGDKAEMNYEKNDSPVQKKDARKKEEKKK